MSGVNKYFFAFLAALFLSASLFHFVSKSEAVYKAGYYDLNIFKQAAVRYWRGEPVYLRSDDLAESYKPGAIIYKFPPPYLINFIPWFDASGYESPDFRLVFTIFYVVIYSLTIFLVCYLVLCCRAGGAALMDYESVLFLMLALAFSAIYMPYFVVQGGTSAESYIVALALLAFISMRRLPWISGFLLVWLSAIKIYPVFLLLYPLITMQWKVLIAAFLSAIGIAVLSLWVFGIVENLFYLKNILPVLLSEPVSEDWTTMFLHTTGNQGVLKVLVSYGILPNRLPFWLNAIRLPFVCALIFLVWRCSRFHDERSWSSVLAFALFVITMVICLPNIFFSYFVMLIFPVLVLGGYFWTRRQWCWLVVLAVCAGSFIVDDTQVYEMVQDAHLLQPTPEVVSEAQRTGVYVYLWNHHKMLIGLWFYGLATPFMPYAFWLLAAIALRSNFLINPARKPVS